MQEQSKGQIVSSFTNTAVLVPMLGTTHDLNGNSDRTKPVGIEKNGED